MSSPYPKPAFKMIDDKLEGWDKLIFNMIVHIAREMRRDRDRSVAIERSLLQIGDFVRNNSDDFPEEMIKALENLEEVHQSHLERSKEGLDDFEELMAKTMAFVSSRESVREG